MAIIDFVQIETLIEGSVLRANGLTTGDTTSIHTINEGSAEVTLHIHGSIGGATVAVLGSLVGDVFSTVDDVYGDAMSYTSLGTNGVIKSVGPALNKVFISVTGGAGVDITVDAYVVRKVR